MPRNRDLFDEKVMTFGEHLNELRVCLWRSVLGLAAGIILALFVSRYVVEEITRPLEEALWEYNHPRGDEEPVLVAGLDRNEDERISLDELPEGVRDRARRIFEEMKIKPDGAATYDQIGDRLPQIFALHALRVGRFTEPEENTFTMEFFERPDRFTVQTALVQTPEALRGQSILMFDSRELDSLMALMNRLQSGRVSRSVQAEGDAEAGGAAPTVFFVISSTPLSATSGPISTEPMGPFMTYLKVTLILGLIIASPWIFYQVWSFIAAGLYRHERAYVYKFLPFSTGLFLGGVLFAFYVVMPYVVTWFLSFNAWFDVAPMIDLNRWVSFALILPVMFGVSFQLPLAMLMLERIGIFSYQAYKSKWRHAVLAIAIISMMLTPADPVSMMFMMTPLVGLYFLGLFLVRRRPKPAEETPAP